MNDVKNPPPTHGLAHGRNSRRANRAVVIILGQAVVIIGLIIALTAVVAAYNDDEEYISAESSRVFEYFGEKDIIKLWDSAFGDTWLEALTDVPRHTYDFNNIKTRNGYKYYYQDGALASKVGIDVSYFQGDIDWQLVSDDGIEFVIIRLGYRGYESGAINIDERFHEYIQGAVDAGLDVGVYFYSQAVSADEAEEEVLAVISELGDYEIAYPIVYDWEVVGEDTARTNDVTVETLNECASVFCNTIAGAGYIPMVYSSKRMALMKLDLSQLAGFDFWLAEYNDEPEFPYNFTIWQYASDGEVNGIEGEVDLNISFVDYSLVRR